MITSIQQSSQPHQMCFGPSLALFTYLLLVLLTFIRSLGSWPLSGFNYTSASSRLIHDLLLWKVLVLDHASVPLEQPARVPESDTQESDYFWGLKSTLRGNVCHCVMYEAPLSQRKQLKSFNQHSLDSMPATIKFIMLALRIETEYMQLYAGEINLQ